MVSYRKWVFILIGFIIYSGFLINYLDRVPKRHYCDFRVYYKAGQDILKGKNIYTRESEEITPFKYSPFFALAFVPLSLLPIKASAAVFFTFNFILTCLFFNLSFHLAESSMSAFSLSHRVRLLIFGLTILCSLRYILLVWDSGQVSILMCTMVLIALHFLSKDKVAWAGAFLASSILIKYTSAIFVPYLFIQRRFKLVFWIILSVGLFLLLPALVVGLQKNVLYLSSWIPSIISTSFDKLSFIDSKNQSIYSMLLRFLSQTQFNVQVLPLSFGQVLLLGKLVALLMFLVALIPGRSKPRDAAVNSALLMACMSLFNPNGWMLNFVSLVPAYMLLIHATVVNKGKDKYILLSLIAAFILTNITSKDLTGVSAENLGCIYSFTTLGALIIYSALLKLKFSRSVSSQQLK